MDLFINPYLYSPKHYWLLLYSHVIKHIYLHRKRMLMISLMMLRISLMSGGVVYVRMYI